MHTRLRLWPAFALLISGAVHAHAFPEQLVPPVGHTLGKSPPAVAITFDADLEPLFSTLVVKRQDGTVVSEAPGRVAASNPRLLTVPLPPLPRGQYEVYWSVVATDGHRTEGHYPFRIQ